MTAGSCQAKERPCTIQTVRKCCVGVVGSIVSTALENNITEFKVIESIVWHVDWIKLAVLVYSLSVFLQFPPLFRGWLSKDNDGEVWRGNCKIYRRCLNSVV